MEKVEVKCENPGCGRVFERNASRVAESKRRGIKQFCSHSCSAWVNNRRRPPQTDEHRARTASSMWRHYSSNPRKREEQSVKRLAFLAEHPEEMQRMRTLHSLSSPTSQTWKDRFAAKGVETILDVSVRTTRKILRRLDIGCSRCG
jgi:hypothetical protein